MPAYSLQPTLPELSRCEELSTKIRLYQGTRAARRRMEVELEELGQRRNLPLPPELVGMIFDFYVHLYSQLPERLLFVCRAWHVLALSQHTLWTDLDPLDPFGLYTVRPWAGTFLQSRVARSNPAPLKADFSRWSRGLQLEDVKKIASIHTFRSRLRELVITGTHDLLYLVGGQPLLTHLTFRGSAPDGFWGRWSGEDLISKDPAKYKLSEKTVTTLRLRYLQRLHVWPESFLQRLQTLEVILTGGFEERHECWSIVQNSVALLTLRITVRFTSAPPLSHASCRNLTIYCDAICSLQEVRMPRLQELTIVTYGSKALMRFTLVDTPISSLRLTCMGGLYEDIGQYEHALWVDGATRLLRSAPRLKRFEISAPSSLVGSISEALAEDSNLCIELNTLIIDGPMGVELEAKERAKDVKAKFEQLRSDVSAFMDQRRLCRSKN